MSRARSRAKSIDQALLRSWPLPRLGAHSDKSTRGDVLVVGGSREVPGAVRLAGEAALRAGAGRIRVATARSAAASMACVFPEARVIGLGETRRGELEASAARGLARELASTDALLIGPGMFDSKLAVALLELAVGSGHGLTAVLDAAALRALRGRKRVRSGALKGIIATPHAGEMAALWGCELQQAHDDPLRLASEAAACLGITLVLKGARTFVVDADGAAYVNTAGNKGLGTAGSGDTLAGIISGLAARGATPVQAAVWGVHLHARAGEVLARRHGPLGYLARELSAELPPLLAKLSRTA